MNMIHTVKRFILHQVIYSIVFLMVGLLILTHGIFYTYVFYKEPIDLEKQYVDEYSRVYVDEYRVIDYIKSMGYVYFIVELPEKNYFLVESLENDYIYTNLVYSIGGELTQHEFCIEGYIKPLNDEEYHRIVIDYNDYQNRTIISRNRIKYLNEPEVPTIILGGGITIVSIICYIVSLKLYLKEKKKSLQGQTPLKTSEYIEAHK